MDDETRRHMVDTLALCRQARERLGPHGAHRTRVLLDMTAQALAQELAILDARTKAPAVAERGAMG